MKQADLTLFLGGLLGMTAVIMAAIGGHAGGAAGAPGVNSSWLAANQMHLVHALAILVLSAMMQRQPRPLLFPAALVMTTGVVLFSGAIYLSQITHWSTATRVTPFGGALLISGWLMVMLSPFRRPLAK